MKKNIEPVWKKEDYTLLLTFAREVKDFRRGNRLVYPSSSIIFMAFLGRLCGQTSWEGIIECAEGSTELLKEILVSDFVGIPSHDTFSRFFSLLKPEVSEKAFRQIMAKVRRRSVNEKEKEVISIDGKYMCGVKDEEGLNMVSVYATRTGLCLGQEEADKKMNEPEQLRKLLQELNIGECIITADALHCQQESVETILEEGADFLLTVKGNQPQLEKAILEGVKVDSRRNRKRSIDYAEETTRGHGRMETRTCYSCSNLDWLSLYGKRWEGIKSFGTVTSRRTVVSTSETTVETRCFISSLKKDAVQQLHILRDHWKIENNLHWQLDVSFSEDNIRMKKNQLKNLSVLAKMAMPVLKAFEYKKKSSLKNKMLAAALKPYIRDKLIQFAIEFYRIS